jgi:hypothetical protein
MPIRAPAEPVPFFLGTSMDERSAQTAIVCFPALRHRSVHGNNRETEIDEGQVICGTVNAGRASFEEGVQDLESFMQRFPVAVRALITARMALADARDAVVARGGIKSVITVA